ncbi:ABC transporter substrate-binding protein [Paenibacillus tyrfis]|uniref:ABC transporter substrate-binding protein n=1 Tax=Paenibacillus tyrfis TaxID=1501230 RepID=UPI00209FE1BA|nr:ABC transporter substrate-binding protein [Paenibacillus tyrfis]MCP1312192.1 ABC transporter substrate-binding protein [Paenibacillus tyrfis]
MNSAFHQMVRLCSIITLLVLLAACGSNGQTAQQASTGANPAGSTDKKEASAPRKFKHVMGETEVPAQPQRVIGLYLEDFLSALDVKPVMQTVVGAFTQKYLEKYTAGLPKLDTGAMNFEAVLEAKPDLILLGFPNYGAEGKYEKFSKIAPTYVFDKDAADDWRGTLRTVGRLLDKSEQAEQLLKRYEEKAAQARKTLEQSIGRETVALIRVHKKEMRLYGGPDGYSGSVLYKDLGLNPPNLVKSIAWTNDGGMKAISSEVLAQLDADHLFLVVDEGRSEQAKELMNSSVWKNIPAVKKGQVHEVTTDVWMTFGLLAYEKKIDDVLQALAKK